MKKINIQNIILYSINFILIGYIILSNKGIISNNNRIILKNMDNTSEISTLNKTIETLNNSHTKYVNYIQSSKQQIINSINMYQNNNATNDNTLEDVSKIISNLTNIPENTYFYESGTEGDSSTIVRYKKIDDNYYLCDVHGIVLEGTSVVDISNKTLIPYSGTIDKNLSAGSAGYSSGSFYLGDGSDNKSHSENNNMLKSQKLTSTDLKTITTHYSELTVSNFYTKLVSVSGSTGPYSSDVGGSGSATLTSSLSYNSTTGTINQISGTLSCNIGKSTSVPKANASYAVYVVMPKTWFDK